MLFDVDIKESVMATNNVQNAISAYPEHYLFKIFRGSMPLNPLEGLKKFFSPLHGSNNFLESTPPKQKPWPWRSYASLQSYCTSKFQKVLT